MPHHVSVILWILIQDQTLGGKLLQYGCDVETGTKQHADRNTSVTLPGLPPRKSSRILFEAWRQRRAWRQRWRNLLRDQREAKQDIKRLISKRRLIFQQLGLNLRAAACWLTVERNVCLNKPSFQLNVLLPLFLLNQLLHANGVFLLQWRHGLSLGSGSVSSPGLLT